MFIEKHRELLGSQELVISSEASKDERSETIRKEYIQVDGSSVQPYGLMI